MIDNEISRTQNVHTHKHTTYTHTHTYFRCTRAGLKAITCPSGLAFDIEKQTCDWKAKVDNCNKKESKFRNQQLTFYLSSTSSVDVSIHLHFFCGHKTTATEASKHTLTTFICINFIYKII